MVRSTRPGLTNEESLTVGRDARGLHNRRSLRIPFRVQPGTIELGKRADFVVVDVILTVEGEE